MTIEELKNSGWIVYHYIRGSVAYGLNTPDSDVDEGGVFMLPEDYLYGLRGEYIEQISDAKSDVVYYEFGRWIELLLKSNPSALESLFVPDDCIIGEVHPIIQELRNNRDLFLSQECFKSVYGYSVSQIEKCRGLNKKIVNPITERKEVLDFCYTFFNQGSMPIKEWLNKNGLKQDFCGLVSTPNMKDVYSVFYDFGAHFKALYEGREVHTVERGVGITEFGKFYYFYLGLQGNRAPIWVTYKNIFNDIEPIGYRGIVSREDDSNESNEVRLSSVPDKNAKPICYVYFNKDAYTCHCRDYKEYKEWEEKRNPVRYKSNLNKNYDAKNVSHAMRLIRMAKELALGQGFNVRRTFDREYLLDVKQHKYEYDDIMAQLLNEKSEMEEAIKNTTLKEKPDYNKINELLINLRKKYYKGLFI